MVHNKINNTDITFIHYARTTAMFAVVLFHVIGGSWTNDPSANSEYYIFVEIASKLLCWHVPVFYMITGYLWLREEKECRYTHIFRHVIHFVCALLVFGFCYALMESVFTARSFHPHMLLQVMKDILEGNLWDHMWYMYSIIGVYLILPILKPFFATQSLKNISIAAGVLFLFMRVIPSIYTDFNGTEPFLFSITGESFLYVFFGGLFSKMRISKKGSVFSAIIGILSSVLIGIQIVMEWNISTFGQILTFVVVVCVFSLFAGMDSSLKGERAIRSASKCSFGIYLLHPLFIHLMLKVFHILPYQAFPVLSIPLAAIVILLLSWAVVQILRKNRMIRKYLL